MFNISIFINSLIVLSVRTFVFASITIWYMFGDKFHRWKREEEEEQENNFKEEVSDDYLENAENASESQERSAGNLKYTEIYHDLSKKLFDLEKTNNLICFKKADGQNKEYQPSISSPIVSQIEEVSSLPPQLQEQEQQHKRFKCFYCSHSYSSDRERIKHIDYQHPGKLYYPTLEDFEKRLL